MSDKFCPLTECQTIIGVELVAEFVEFVSNFDDETYLNDFYKVESDFDDEYADDDFDEGDTSSVTVYYCYRSDNVGYLGEMLIVNDEMVTWTPHETLEFRLSNPNRH
jgi:hypothetical protein